MYTPLTLKVSRRWRRLLSRVNNPIYATFVGTTV
jgi:hypothetical protein